MAKRVIFLVDCQSFYASVEKAARPELQNKPVVVAGDPERRSGIVLAACPIAKKHGIQTGEWIGTAVGKCPELVVMKPRMQTYIDVSLLITRILESFTDLVEPYSIDEQFLDVTGSLRLFGDPWTIAKAIQERILQETGIFARIGIAENKVLAKMACDIHAKKRPDGLFELRKDAIAEHLWPHPVEEMFGVGSRMRAHLFRLGIRTIGDLAKTPLSVLKKRWGVNGIVLWQTANGIDHSPVSVTTHELQKAIGHQMTLPRDYGTKEEIETILLELTEEVCRRSRSKGLMGQVVSVGCMGADFDMPSGFWRQMRLPEPTNATNHVYRVARELFHRFWDGLPIRRAGVALSDLIPEDEYQIVMFDEREKYRALERVTDAIKQKYGDTAILRAASLTKAGQAAVRANKIGGHAK